MKNRLGAIIKFIGISYTHAGMALPVFIVFHYLLSNNAFISMLMIATTDGAARIRTTLCHSVIQIPVSRVASDWDL